MVIDHLAIQCADMAASSSFYDAVLAPLGGTRIMEFDDVIGYGTPPMPVFWIGPSTTGAGFRESHIAFAAPDRDAVIAFFHAAVAAGAEVLHSRGSGPSTTPTTSVPSSAIPTATTWRPSATRPADQPAGTDHPVPG